MPSPLLIENIRRAESPTPPSERSNDSEMSRLTNEVDGMSVHEESKEETKENPEHSTQELPPPRRPKRQITPPKRPTPAKAQRPAPPSNRRAQAPAAKPIDSPERPEAPQDEQPGRVKRAGKEGEGNEVSGPSLFLDARDLKGPVRGDRIDKIYNLFKQYGLEEVLAYPSGYYLKWPETDAGAKRMAQCYNAANFGPPNQPKYTLFGRTLYLVAIWMKRD